MKDVNTLYEGFVNIYESERERDGKVERFTRVKLRGASAGIVINENGEMALVKQYRPILGKYTLEVPCGTLDKGISKKDIIIEELDEECGISKEDIISITEEPILTYNIIENMSDGEMHIFYIKVKNVISNPHMDDDVDEVNFYSIKEIDTLIKNRVITDPKTLISFYLYKDMLNG